MIKNILITQDKNRAQNLVENLERSGFLSFLEPLFMVKKLAVSIFEGETFFVIITSANAIPAVIESGISKKIKIYTVGKSTAEKLKKLGFENVIFSSKNSAKDLKDIILQQEIPAKGLYFRGSVISLDFKVELKKCGFVIEDILSYETIENHSFSENLLEVSKVKNFDYVLIFSQNSAKIFLKLAKKHNLLEYFKKSEILVISKKIIEVFDDFGFTNVKLFASLQSLKKFYD
jgi:uroporphyrinogen-III synthase